ncbi:MAG: RdgB/HAM1 family non-canonical purine NTP pyrophosphatase [Candidatus Pacebacteria bacterium]|nr:RdgB/HAM1 family non-canonical purine NTP pyrophosphatase [Candidatus Paceibacterota bacterium]PIR60790.1 MAG: non-canonical purine NTP pyrophosphatase, RdgB/HAM1 family [Candidatus Pacebacteria bacterium CG10_big_fil_rev_8_21_14_0_10_44_54]
MRLLVATQNPGKQQEIRSLLKTSGIELLFPNQIPTVANLDVAETGKTFAENAELKARAFAQESGIASIAEDTGLQVAVLGGEPGVASKRWLSGSDYDRNKALLDRLADNPHRAAKFVTVAYFYDPISAVGRSFTGEMSGEIAMKISNDTGFGYDSIFIPTEEKEVLAKLGLNKKNTISHRSIAFTQVVEYLQKINL